MNWVGFSISITLFKTNVNSPNIRLKRGATEIIDLKNYMKFVDSSFDILNTKNNKPIFVPVSMRMGKENLAN